MFQIFQAMILCRMLFLCHNIKNLLQNKIIFTFSQYTIHTAFPLIWKSIDAVELICITDHEDLYPIFPRFGGKKIPEDASSTEFHELLINSEHRTRNPILLTLQDYVVPDFLNSSKSIKMQKTIEIYYILQKMQHHYRKIQIT